MNDWTSSTAQQSGVKMFVCYRRREEAVGVRGICRLLQEKFGKNNVFVDVDGIPAGTDYRVILPQRVAACDVLLAIITEKWLTLQNQYGKRKLDAEDDFVRVEIEAALNRGIQVIPVLLDNAPQPAPEGLPKSIEALAFRQSIPIRGGTDYEHDIERLIAVLRDAEEALESVRKERNLLIASVERGDWLLARGVRPTVAASKEVEATAQFAALIQLRRQVELLTTAAEALERGELAVADEVLSRVEGQPPPIVEAAHHVVRIGLRAQRSAPGDVTALRGQMAELDDVVSRCATVAAKVPGEREVRALLQRMLRESEVQDAHRLYETGSFAAAAEIFDRAGDTVRAGYCQLWMTALEHVRSHEWETAAAALKPVLDRKEERAVTVQKWCSVASRVVPALERLARGGALAEKRVVGESAVSPYHKLDASPSLTLEECNELTYEYQKNVDGMTTEQRVAIDALRLVDTRLLVDFSTYTIRDGARAAAVLRRHYGFDAEEPHDRILGRILGAGQRPDRTRPAPARAFFEPIVTELGDDGGILYVITKNYDAAIETFLGQVRRAPWDATALHHLGLAAHAKAHMHPDAYEVDTLWNWVAIAWGAVFADKNFWRAWWAQRRRVYPVPREEQIDTARATLTRRCADELRGVGERDCAPGELFRSELYAARTVATLGGIPVGASQQQRAVVGGQGVMRLQLSKHLASWIAEFPLDAVRRESTHRDICIAFSSLGPAQALYDEKRFDDAIAVLDGIVEDHEESFATANPGFAALAGGQGQAIFLTLLRNLLQQCHVHAALAAVSAVPVDIDGAIAHWQKALAVSRWLQNADAITQEIRNAVAGRCNVLLDEEREETHRLDALNDAVKLAQDALGQGWDDSTEILRLALVASLLARATHLSNKYDMEREARQDALRACGLAPDSLRTIIVLCGASLHYAKELYHAGDLELARALHHEVEERLAEGKKLFPGNPELDKIVQASTETAALLAGGTNSIELALAALRNTAAELKSEPGDTRLAQAMVFEAQSDCARAVDLYWQLVQEKPGDRESIGRLSWCYRFWLRRLFTNGEMDEYARVSAEAKERCPDSPVLSDVIDAHAEAQE